jgi:hypothetical protein
MVRPGGGLCENMGCGVACMSLKDVTAQGREAMGPDADREAPRGNTVGAPSPGGTVLCFSEQK